MKKILIVCMVFLMAAAVFVGCGASKAVISPDAFSNTMAGSGYSVIDDTATSAGSADSVLLALAPDGSYQIEYVKVSSADAAKDIFNYNVSLFEQANDGTGAGQTDSGQNYDIYGLKTAGRNMYICRVDGTCIYVDTTSLDRAPEIESIITSLGY